MTHISQQCPLSVSTTKGDIEAINGSSKWPIVSDEPLERFQFENISLAVSK